MSCPPRPTSACRRLPTPCVSSLLACTLVGLTLATAFPSLASETRRSHLYRPDANATTPKAPPKRIVSLAPVLTETLFALGAGDSVVGVTRYCDRPAAAARLPKVGGYVDTQLEVLLALEPDLVVAMPSLGQRQVLDRLRERGVPVWVAFGDRIEEVRDLVAGLGALLQREAEAARVLAELDGGLATIKSISAKSTNRLRATVVFQVDPLVVAGPSTFPEEALVLAGALPAAPRNAPAWPTWSLEALLAVAPDVLVAAEGPAAAARLRELLTRGGPRAARIRVVAHEAPILIRPGPSLHDDVAVLAHLLREASAPTPADRGQRGEKP